MIIRTATKEDAYKVSCLWEQMVNESRPDFTPNREWWEKMFISFMNTPIIKYNVVVAEYEGELVGFIDGFVFPEPSTGKVHGVGQHFYILPEHRQSTIAGRLYVDIVGIALRSGAEVLEFFCFPEGIPFWSKRGFTTARIMMRREVPNYV